MEKNPNEDVLYMQQTPEGVRVVVFSDRVGAVKLTPAEITPGTPFYLDVRELQVNDILALPTHGIGECVRITEVSDVVVKGVVWGGAATATPQLRQFNPVDLNSTTNRPMAVIRHDNLDVLALPPQTAHAFIVRNDKGKVEMVVRKGRTWRMTDKNQIVLMPFGVQVRYLAPWGEVRPVEVNEVNTPQDNIGF